METIKESGLSRVYNSMLEHDCGAMTAYRVFKDEAKTIKFTKVENQTRNKLLLAKLFKLGYGVTKTIGYYSEDGVDEAEGDKENSFFIVDIKDKGKLKNDLINLASDKDFGIENHFHQDAILFIPRGGKESLLIGTNYNSDIGYLQKIPLGEFIGGTTGENYTRINGRPFIFKFKETKECNSSTGTFGKWALNASLTELKKQVLENNEKGEFMKLTKSHLIEGKVYEKGTELVIKESSNLDYDIDNRLGVLTVYQGNNEIGFLHEDVKDLVSFMNSSSKTFMVETGAMVFKKTGNTIKISLTDLDESITLTKEEILELENIADSSNRISKRSAWY